MGTTLVISKTVSGVIWHITGKGGTIPTSVPLTKSIGQMVPSAKVRVKIPHHEIQACSTNGYTLTYVQDNALYSVKSLRGRFGRFVV
jgi:hypothetical protein